ncbi:MAG: VOC family protein [Gemmatimonadota bacterium]
MKAAHPYLNFPGTAEEAFEFYRSVFGGEFSAVVRFRDFGEDALGASEDELDKIAHIGLALAGDVYLMASDVVSSSPAELTVGNNFYITLQPDDAEEARRLFDGLSAAGDVEMGLQRTGWAELYGSFTDRFGVRWMINYEGDASPGG